MSEFSFSNIRVHFQLREKQSWVSSQLIKRKFMTFRPHTRAFHVLHEELTTVDPPWVIFLLSFNKETTGIWVTSFNPLLASSFLYNEPKSLKVMTANKMLIRKLSALETLLLTLNSTAHCPQCSNTQGLLGSVSSQDICHILLSGKTESICFK